MEPPSKAVSFPRLVLSSFLSLTERLVIMNPTCRLFPFAAVLLLVLFFCEALAKAEEVTDVPSLIEWLFYSGTRPRSLDVVQSRDLAPNILGKRVVQFSFGEAVGGSGAVGGCNPTAQGVITDGFTDVTDLANNAATAATSTNINAVRLRNFLFPNLGSDVLEGKFLRPCCYAG